MLNTEQTELLKQLVTDKIDYVGRLIRAESNKITLTIDKDYLTQLQELQLKYEMILEVPKSNKEE